MSGPAASSVARIASPAPGLDDQRIKVKIKPGWDVDVMGKVRRRQPGVLLSADANAAYTLADREHLKGLDPAALLMIEQPLDHDDILDHATSGFTLPGDISASRRYFARDIIAPEVEVAPDGTIAVPQGPGLGFEVDVPFLESHREAGERLARPRP
jgi:L-alanine-DL-glutamate epimerase-like enolase superfamily enzyme